jgi:hypothetical protein
MTTRKAIWDTLDELEGKEVGSSYTALSKEKIRQGHVLTPEELELMRQCDGKHPSLDELFACKSCDVMFKD